MKKYLGYHKDEDLPFKKGQEVWIPRGTVVRSTHPDLKEKILTRGQRVQIHHLLPGQTYPLSEKEYLRRHGRTDADSFPEVTVTLHKGTDQEYSYQGIATMNPAVCWPGTGGYWMEVDINDVQELPEEK